MWSLNNYKTVFVAVGLIGVLVFSLPSVVLFARGPPGEVFSELYALGPGHMAEGYPFNVSAGGSYMVYLGVGNHMGSSVYYEVDVKFRNSIDRLPNATSGEASPLPVVYMYRVLLGDGGVWEAPLNFSLLNVGLYRAAKVGDFTLVGKLDVNGVVVDVSKVSFWDNEAQGFYYQVFVELWRYNVTTSSFGFDSRFISLWLNVTQSF
jgi:hypothetical protein